MANKNITVIGTSHVEFRIMDLHSVFNVKDKDVVAFWDDVEYRFDGKKSTLHLNGTYTTLEKEQAFIMEKLNRTQLFQKYPTEVVVKALLDLDKANQYFGTRVLNELWLIRSYPGGQNYEMVSYGKREVGFFEVELFDWMESLSISSNELPAGFHSFFDKIKPKDLKLNKPGNKMAVMVWQSKMKNVKITQKLWRQILLSMSIDKDLRTVQWDTISDNLNNQAPKWLISEISKGSWMSSSPYWFTKRHFHNI